MQTDVAEAKRQRRLPKPAVRLDLQGMRAFAVLTVFADHLFDWPRGGFVGVDVFFVLSGFFITGLLIRERTQDGKVSFRRFYVRRVRRIIPSAVLVITVTVIVSHFLLPAPRARDALLDGLWASAFLSNWRFERATNYFAEGQPPSPLLHYWSLSIEEQFYFVWPFLLVALFALTRRYSTRGERYPAARQWWLGVFMSAICAASFAWACFLFLWDPTGAYFSTLTRIWELGVGALLAICTPLLARIPDAARPFLSYIGFAGAVASLFVISPITAFPGPWAALPVLSTALVIASFAGGEVRAVPHLTNRGCTYIGEVSYTLYLWHWPVIVLLAAVLPPGPLFNTVAIALAGILTVTTYHFYEDRIRRSSWLEPGSSYGLATPQWYLAGATAAVVIVASAAVLEIQEFRSSSAQENQVLVVSPAAPSLDEATRCLGASALTRAGCVRYDPAKPLVPDIDHYADDTQGAYECYRFPGEQQLESCNYGYTGPGGKRIAVVGDSHAAMLLPALAPYLIENKWSMTTFVGRSCQWEIRPTGVDNCSNAMRHIEDTLLAERFDVVVATASRNYGTVQGYADAYRPVVENGSKVLIVADVPSVTAETLACVTRLGGNPGECATPREVALAKPDATVAAAQLVPGVKVLDMTNSFCDVDRCYGVIGNVIVYRDSGAHLTATYMKSLSPQLVGAIRELMG